MPLLGKQGHGAGLLNSSSDGSLVTGTGAGLGLRHNPIALRNIPTQLSRVLVIRLKFLVHAEETVLLAAQRCLGLARSHGALSCRVCI